MFEEFFITSSAISTFNNAALLAPEFLYMAILAIPLFYIAWIMTPEILARFLPNPKIRENQIALLTVIVIFIWTVTHQNFGVLRAESFVGILNAIIMCGSMVFLSRRYYESEWRPAFARPVAGLRRYARYFIVPASIMIIVGLFAIQSGWAGVMLQMGAVGIGILSGWLLQRKNAAERDVKFLTAALMAMVSYGLIMQPEFFRFGQFANLTFVHILGLLIVASLIALFFALYFFRPRGYFKKLHFERVQILTIAALSLVTVVLLITESALLFLAFAGVIFGYSVIAIAHFKKSKADELQKLKTDVWIVSLFAFGILATLPVLSFAAILLWRAESRDNFINSVRNLLVKR